MSQQEFVPQSKRSEWEQQQPLHDDEIYHPQHPYFWSTNKAGEPRDEPPSSYDEPIMQHGYQAQDHASRAHRGRLTVLRPNDRTRSDGDAYEQGYHAYNQYNVPQGIPPWARPQPQKKNLVRVALFIVLGLLLLKPILIVLGFLAVAIAGLIGLTFLAIVLPLVFVVGLVSILLIILRLAFWRRRMRYRRGHFPPWGGPWGW